jgi:hypothetical protein
MPCVIKNTLVMKDYLAYVNDYISGVLSSELMVEVKARLATDEELHNEYRILLSSREYIKAKSMLEEIETEPELHHVEDLVEQFFNEQDEFRRMRYRKRKYLVITIHILSILFLATILFIRISNSF